MTISEQLHLLSERRDQSWPSLHGAQVTARPMRDVLQVRTAVVRHRVMLQVSPDAFDRIELRSVGRQIFQGDPITLRLDVRPHEFGAVRLQTAPDNEDLSTDRLLQGLQELHDLRALDRAIEQTEVKSPVAQARDHRQLLPAEAVLKHRRLSLRGPGACATGSLRRNR